jgi:hypothetical protein
MLVSLFLMCSESFLQNHLISITGLYIFAAAFVGEVVLLGKFVCQNSEK